MNALRCGDLISLFLQEVHFTSSANMDRNFDDDLEWMAGQDEDDEQPEDQGGRQWEMFDLPSQLSHEFSLTFISGRRDLQTLNEKAFLRVSAEL
jgi:hypothetical protein